MIINDDPSSVLAPGPHQQNPALPDQDILINRSQYKLVKNACFTLHCLLPRLRVVRVICMIVVIFFSCLNIGLTSSDLHRPKKYFIVRSLYK